MAAATLPRELTAAERAAIRKLVIEMCANYDGAYKLCLPLDCPCVMLHKWWTGGGCKYFRNAVLPLNPALENALTGGAAVVGNMRSCDFCGKLFPVSKSQAYCSPACQREGNRKKSRERMRKKRGKRYDLDP
jgi:hypothetical protein